MEKKRLSFFERLTGGGVFEGDNDVAERKLPSASPKDWIEEENEEGQLSVDVYQTPDHIIVKTMVAGVRPEDLNISITREMVTIKGKREEAREIMEEDYFSKELYWGSFSRTVFLPEEVDPEKAEAFEKHGLLTIKLPKIDKQKSNQLKVRSG